MREGRDEEPPATARAAYTPSAFEYRFTYSRGAGGALTAREAGDMASTPRERSAVCASLPHGQSFLSQSLDSSLATLSRSVARRQDLAPLAAMQRLGQAQVLVMFCLPCS